MPLQAIKYEEVKDLLLSSAAWEEWLKPKLYDYYRASRKFGPEIRLYELSEHQRAIKIYREVVTKLIEQMRFFPFREMEYNFSGACEALTTYDQDGEKRVFPHFFAISDALKALD